MFRPDRIGTPFIHTQNQNSSVLTTALNTGAFSGVLNGNVMNATPLGDFDRMQLRWSAAAKSLPNNNKACLIAQMVIAQPLAGDTVAIEVMAGMVINLPGILVVPIFTQINTPSPNTVWQQIGTTGAVTPLMADMIPSPPAAPDIASAMRSFQFKENVLVRNTVAGTPAGTFGFGFALYNATGAAVSFTELEFYAACRQGMDQNGVQYTDTRR